MAASRTIHLEGIGPVLLERSRRARRITMTVNADRIRVAVPKGATYETAEAFAREKQPWLRSVTGRLKARAARLRDIDGLQKLDLPAAKAALRQRLEELSRQYGYPYRGVTVRAQKTRWGSCSHRDAISLNVKLMLLPVKYRDYVILHELVHTRHHNHGSRFWDELEGRVPGAREMARRLREEYDLRLM